MGDFTSVRLLKLPEAGAALSCAGASAAGAACTGAAGITAGMGMGAAGTQAGGFFSRRMLLSPSVISMAVRPFSLIISARVLISSRFMNAHPFSNLFQYQAGVVAAEA